jgi:glycosyltransferase involved in cell wall biosynthesis
VKVLWISNSPYANSGYGSQTRQVGRRLLDAGYELEFAVTDRSAGDTEWLGCLVRGAGFRQYSMDTLSRDLVLSKADVAIMLYDAFPFAERDPFEGADHLWGWCPVDHMPLPPEARQWMQRHPTIAMSRFGEAMMRSAGGIDCRYVPHALEKVFAPTPVAPEFGKPFRQASKIPEDAYLVGTVAASTDTALKDRKGYGDMAQAMGRFMADHEDVWWYVHTSGLMYQALNFQALMAACGVPDERLVYADPYPLAKGIISDQMMASIYTSFDVLLNTSRGEGFGLPVIEAQACGTPVIASNFTAQPELLGAPFDPQNAGSQRRPSGWLVACDPDYDPYQGAFFGKPNTLHISAALEDAYQHRGDTEMHDAALAQAKEYDADHVFETYWKPVLAEMTQPRHMNREQRRALRRKVAA